MTEGFIYTITLKGAAKPCYVGQTRNKPERRWRAHSYARTRVGRALQLLGPEAFDFAVIERVPLADLQARECFWIAKFGTLEPNGLNVAEGGYAPKKSEATRARISAAHRARWDDPAFRSNAVARMNSPEAIEKRRQAAVERAKTPEGREQLERARSKRKPISREKQQQARAKQGASTPEAREKMSRSASQRAATAEGREQLRRASAGRIMTPEWREQLRQAAVARWKRAKENGVFG
jgi:hypothetical protein